jgi:DNA-binding GntR family transcriptional regulator
MAGDTAADGVARVRTAHEWVRERLRTDIMNGLYRPGDPLKQTELAARWDVSVTPVREAMRDLATEGLVVVDPQRVARVRSLDEDEAREVGDIRYLLEPLAARLAASKAAPEAVAEIRRLAEESAAAETDTEWLDSNRRLHMEIINGAGAPLLTGILANLRQISSIYLATAVRTAGGMRDKSKREHLALAEAIAAGDADAAESIMQAHLYPSESMASVAADERDRSERRPPA